MKWLLIIWMPILLFGNCQQGQTKDATIQKLIENKVIRKKHVREFEEILTQFGSKSELDYLVALHALEFKNWTGLSVWPSDSYIATSYAFLPPADQARANKELLRYNSGLASSGLIDESTHTRFLGKILQSSFFNKTHLLSGIIEYVEHKMHMAPDKLAVFAEKLNNHGIVDERYEQLKTDIQQGKLQNPIDFLSYCDKAVILRVEDYPDEPEEYLELIHRTTASILPELKFSDFEYALELDSSNSYDDSKDYEWVISLLSNGKKYSQRSFCCSVTAEMEGTEGAFLGKIDQQEYYKIFNKVLTDLQSPYRLYEVKSYRRNALDWHVFGIIALTIEQADFLHGGGVYFSPSFENHQNTLTSKKIEEAIEEFKKIGLLAHLTPKQIEDAKRRVNEQSNSSLAEVLEAFPEVIYIFDAELANLEDPYAELVREFKRISHGDFHATDISDNFDIDKNTEFELRFRMGDKQYIQPLKVYNDWIDSDYFFFIENVVNENNLNGQFYLLYSEGQEISIIYLTQEQYKYLKTNELLHL